MLYLEDVLNLAETLGLVEDGHLYMGILDAKKQCSIGIYNSKRSHPHSVAIGGKQNESYGTKYTTFLVHWNKSSRETERAAVALFERLEQIRDVTINNKTIKFVQLLTEPISVGVDDNGIFESVIEVAFVYEKGTGE